MPVELLEHVFDEDAKVSRTGTANEKGTGLGMPMIKRYMEKAGGKVEVACREKDLADPNPPSGTTVRLTFPFLS